jgi:choline dehydrogenase-like flavoprotein
VKVVVVGSGLSAVGALKALIAAGVKPVVIDAGHKLELPLQKVKSRLSSVHPSSWSSDDLKVLADNKTSKSAVPKKLVMGSDYFYATDNPNPIRNDVFSLTSPPYSLALGGFSSGWGGAFLPPSESDIADWPISREELVTHMRECMRNIACSEPDDDLSEHFPSLKSGSNEVLTLTAGQQKLLRTLRSGMKSTSRAPEVVGQSRVMTRSVDTGSLNGCQYCGFCSSGCVYDAIYKADFEISQMIREEQIDYLGGWLVTTMAESGSMVEISMVNESTGEKQILEADRAFLAAGAVNSTRILLQSQSMFGFRATIKQTGGFIQPFASAVHYPVSWPEQNTQSNLFLEFKELKLSEHWVHVQISQPNEVLMSKLGLTHSRVDLVRGKLIKFASGNLLVAMLNTHSAHGSRYVVQIGSHFVNGVSQFESKQVVNPDHRFIMKVLNRRLKKIFRRHGAVALGFLRQESSRGIGYHFGSSFPMTLNPKSPTDTDSLGRPFGWQNVFVVDTSVLPSIPGTSIGMLSMANAHRIATTAIAI